MKLTFHGAAGGVTGSCTLLQTDRARILVDCGMFQGPPAVVALNARKFPFRPREIDAVLLTHAHIDHAGLLPRLVAEGFSGPIHATRGTCELARILLEDSARIQQKDAEAESRRRRREGRRGMEPFYSVRDVERACERLVPVGEGQGFTLADGSIDVRFRDAGHILGSVSILLEVAVAPGKRKRICFSGDIGNPGRPILRDPMPAPECDLLVLESTYGDRDHPPSDETDDRLAAILERAARDGGTLLVPAFAVGRAQEVLYRLRSLSETRRLPFPDVYLDSPLATKAMDIVCRHPECWDAEAQRRVADGRWLFGMRELHVIRTPEESMRLNEDASPKIIVAASGMCEGGPILHHLRHHLWRPETDLLFTGYQAEGTLGRRILEGAKHVRVHGRLIAVKARIHEMTGLSAHADRVGLAIWARTAGRPSRTFLNHGEPAAARALATKLAAELGHAPEIPERGSSYEV